MTAPSSGSSGQPSLLDQARAFLAANPQPATPSSAPLPFAQRIRALAPSTQILGKALAYNKPNHKPGINPKTDKYTTFYTSSGASITFRNITSENKRRKVTFADLTHSQKNNPPKPTMATPTQSLNPRSILIKKTPTIKWKFKENEMESPASRKIEKQSLQMKEEQQATQDFIKQQAQRFSSQTPVRNPIQEYLFSRQLALTTDPEKRKELLLDSIKQTVAAAMPRIKAEAASGIRPSRLSLNPSLARHIAGSENWNKENMDPNN